MKKGSTGGGPSLFFLSLVRHMRNTDVTDATTKAAAHCIRSREALLNHVFLTRLLGRSWKGGVCLKGAGPRACGGQVTLSS